MALRAACFLSRADALRLVAETTGLNITGPEGGTGNGPAAAAILQTLASVSSTLVVWESYNIRFLAAHLMNTSYANVPPYPNTPGPHDTYDLVYEIIYFDNLTVAEFRIAHEGFSYTGASYMREQSAAGALLPSRSAH